MDEIIEAITRLIKDMERAFPYSVDEAFPKSYQKLAKSIEKATGKKWSLWGDE